LDLLPPGSPSGYGGIEGFLDLIEFDAATIVRNRWPVDATRSALFGHSHGGLATLHALFTRPTLFRNWIAVSPSIWFARHALRRKEAVFARQVEHFEVMPRVHISVGSRESEVPAQRPHGASIGSGEVERQIKAARMVSNARQLALRLKVLKGGPGYELHYESLRGETHSSAPFAMVCDALQMAFAEVPKN
jgi:uncharacterized protein